VHEERDHRADGETGEAIAGQVVQQISKLVARGPLQAVGHDVHAVDEKGESAEDLRDEKGDV